MTPIELAYRVFPGQFKVKGQEIIPTHCPFCMGGSARDRDTFALNIDTGLYNCKRGKCAEQGNLNQLAKHFGVRLDKKEYELRKPKQEKTYIKPKTEIKETSTEIEKYLQKRGFSKETWESMGIGESNNRIVFPYYERGQLVAVKFRAKDEQGKWKNFSMEKGGKLVLWGMDNCYTDFPLFITEGEFDALALQEAGIPNAVSLPNGAENLQCIDLCWDWLQQFNQIYIWTDNDEPGIKCRNELVKRLGAGRCLVVQTELKDANEVLYKEGKEGIAKAISNAQPIPLEGVKDLADLEEYEPENDITVPSTLDALNNTLNGGYRLGEVTVWTGINGSGKSTFLGQEMLQAVEEGFTVCVYSGELSDRIFRYWIDLQAAGQQFITEKTYKGRTIRKPNPDIIQHIRKWYGKKFFIYDGQAATQDKILEVFEYVVQRYNCKVFMIDNLMSLALNTSTESDFYRKQADFIGKCKDFAKNYNVHIHIVAHPRKVKAGEHLTKMDIAGSGNISNWVDNVMEVKRLSPKEIADIQSKAGNAGLPVVSTLNLLKNRFEGKQDIAIMLGFESISKRFYQCKDSTPHFQFSWVNAIGLKSTRDDLREWDEMSKGD